MPPVRPVRVLRVTSWQLLNRDSCGGERCSRDIFGISKEGTRRVRAHLKTYTRAGLGRRDLSYARTQPHPQRPPHPAANCLHFRTHFGLLINRNREKISILPNDYSARSFAFISLECLRGEKHSNQTKQTLRSFNPQAN